MKTVCGRRQRLLLVWVARLALLTYVFQLSAADHWHRNPASIVGVPGESRHVYHCHGAPSSCAEQGGSVTATADSRLTPIPPAPLTSRHEVSQQAPAAVVLPSADEPPQSAVS